MQLIHGLLDSFELRKCVDEFCGVCFFFIGIVCEMKFSNVLILSVYTVCNGKNISE